ncbi:hypothetical protein B1218_35050, partial [Pseudomonas ogarae]
GEGVRGWGGWGDALGVGLPSFLPLLGVVRHERQAGGGSGLRGVAGRRGGFASRVGAGAGDGGDATVELGEKGKEEGEGGRIKA